VVLKPSETLSARTVGARLPGLRFETVPPDRSEVLPRMDIAVFVGFAARGPLHIPVPVEDVAGFEAIFGADLPLAWDTERGEITYAYLAPAVRTFFRHGGRRCWVIRVAGEQATRACLPIPGLAGCTGSALTPAFAVARSPGSWADGLRVAAALSTQPIELIAADLANGTFDLKFDSTNPLCPGDLLRLIYDDGEVLLVTITSLQASEADAVKVLASKLHWFQQLHRRTAPAELQLTAYHPAGPTETFSARVATWPENNQQMVRLDCFLPGENSPLVAGALIQAATAGEIFWLLIEQVDTVALALDSPPGAQPTARGVRLSGHGLWQCGDLAATIGSLALAEKLTFELWARHGDDDPTRLRNLGFAAPQPRFWAALPEDEALFGGPAPDAYANLWRAAGSPRFPLAGAAAEATYLPIAIPTLPSIYASPSPPTLTALQRDGLDVFTADLFLDADLADATTEALLERGDFLRFTGPNPRRLRGLHAALSIDEATLIAIPDAVQRGWERPPEVAPTLPNFNPHRPHPEWWRYLPCESRQQITAIHEPQRGHFLDCNLRVLAVPDLWLAEPPDRTGSFALAWFSPDPVDHFILEESAFPDFAEAHEIYRGPGDEQQLYGYGEGDYFYRVRSETNIPLVASDWSPGVAVQISARPPWQVVKTGQYDAQPLMQVQWALRKMCAARGDLFAVLALPGHYHTPQARAYARDLRRLSEDGYERSLSFAALFHPWLVGPFGSDATQQTHPGALRLLPPDGAQCGLMARQAIERGAWVAPANQLLRGVVALEPALLPADWLTLQESHINLLRQEPRGFLCLDADTLSDDPDWRPLNVRRLITVLRRLALRYGPTYVFEPNDLAFQRLVERTFNRLLDFLYQRNAFAGRTPETSYQVSTNVSPQDRDAGRFILELRVAPSLPMRFITVRLMQSGERSQVIEGG